MNNNTLLGVGALFLVGYLLFRNKKNTNEVKVSDLDGQSLVVIPPIIRNLKPDLTLTDLSSSTDSRVGFPKPVFVRRARLVLDEVKVPLKTPITIPAINLVPSIYNREVGKELAVSFSGESQEYYENMGGLCTEQISSACKCSVEKKPKYKLNIPQLP